MLLLTVFLPACGSGLSHISGEATYENEPIHKGRIEFMPEDGKGAGGGGDIVDGKYQVKGLQPGPKRVQITATKVVPFARTSEEMARRAREAQARGDATGLIDPADIVPPDAEGNNVVVELQPGSQTRDFALKKPAKKK
jgi:hypothetical protein